MAEFVSLVLESDQGLIYVYVWVISCLCIWRWLVSNFRGSVYVHVLVK